MTTKKSRPILSPEEAQEQAKIFWENDTAARKAYTKDATVALEYWSDSKREWVMRDPAKSHSMPSDKAFFRIAKVEEVKEEVKKPNMFQELLEITKDLQQLELSRAANAAQDTQLKSMTPQAFNTHKDIINDTVLVPKDKPTPPYSMEQFIGKPFHIKVIKGLGNIYMVTSLTPVSFLYYNTVHSSMFGITWKELSKHASFEYSQDYGKTWHKF